MVIVFLTRALQQGRGVAAQHTSLRGLTFTIINDSTNKTDETAVTDKEDTSASDTKSQTSFNEFNSTQQQGTTQTESEGKNLDGSSLNDSSKTEFKSQDDGSSGATTTLEGSKQDGQNNASFNFADLNQNDIQAHVEKARDQFTDGVTDQNTGIMQHNESSNAAYEKSQGQNSTEGTISENETSESTQGTSFSDTTDTLNSTKSETQGDGDTESAGLSKYQTVNGTETDEDSTSKYKYKNETDQEDDSQNFTDSKRYNQTDSSDEQGTFSTEGKYTDTKNGTEIGSDEDSQSVLSANTTNKTEETSDDSVKSDFQHALDDTDVGQDSESTDKNSTLAVSLRSDFKNTSNLVGQGHDSDNFTQSETSAQKAEKENEEDEFFSQSLNTKQNQTTMINGTDMEVNGTSNLDTSSVDDNVTQNDSLTRNEGKTNSETEKLVEQVGYVRNDTTGDGGKNMTELTGTEGNSTVGENEYKAQQEIKYNATTNSTDAMEGTTKEGTQSYEDEEVNEFQSLNRTNADGETVDDSTSVDTNVVQHGSRSRPHEDQNETLDTMQSDSGNTSEKKQGDQAGFDNDASNESGSETISTGGNEQALANNIQTKQDFENDFNNQVMNKSQETGKIAEDMKAEGDRKVYIGNDTKEETSYSITDQDLKPKTWTPSVQTIVIVGLVVLVGYLWYRNRSKSRSSFGALKELQNRQKKQDIENTPILGLKNQNAQGYNRGPDKKGQNSDAWKDF